MLNRYRDLCGRHELHTHHGDLKQRCEPHIGSKLAAIVVPQIFAHVASVRRALDNRTDMRRAPLLAALIWFHHIFFLCLVARRSGRPQPIFWATSIARRGHNSCVKPCVAYLFTKTGITTCYLHAGIAGLKWVSRRTYTIPRWVRQYGGRLVG